MNHRQLEGLQQLTDIASYWTVRVFRLVFFTCQSEDPCSGATIIKYDPLFLSGCHLADL